MAPFQESLSVQSELFLPAEAAPAIPGLRYEAAFLARDEEASLLEVIRSLPLHAAEYKEYLARRPVLSFGGSFDYDTNTLCPGEPLDERLLPLRKRVADWLGVGPGELVHALVAEYGPGTPLGWHRDVPEFEVVAGVSLGSAARLRFRPYPPGPVARRKVLALEPAPPSIYPMEGQAGWGCEDRVPPVKALRWSITFRTRRQGR